MVALGVTKLPLQPTSVTLGTLGRPSQLIHAFAVVVPPQPVAVVRGTWTYNGQPGRSWSVTRGVVYGPW